MLNALALKIIAGVCAVLMVVVLIQDRNRWKARSTSLTAQILAERKTYETAQREAELKNKAEVSRITREQEEVTREVESNLSARLERLRRELRQQATPAGGSTSRPRTSPDGKAPGGADAAPRVCLAPSDVLRGAENEERHDQLIDWIERQLGVKR